jgi:hypothetical protein
VPDCPLPPGSLVAAYARDSGGVGQDRSVDQQIAAIAAYCQDHGLTLARVFADEAQPGSSVVSRDRFLEMVAWLRRLAPEPEQHRRRDPAAPDGILYWDLKRFGRDQDDGTYFRADLRRRGYAVLSLADDIPAGDLAPVFEALFSWKAEQDLHDLSRDVKRGLHDLLLSCGPDGEYLHAWTGRVPPGFRRTTVQAGIRRDGQPRQVQGIEPDRGGEWERVQQAFALRAAGASLARIVRETRLRARRRPFYRLFRNELYVGRLVYGSRAVEGWIEPCVDAETWQAVQAVNAANGDRPPRLGTSGYTLSGWLKCAACGANLVGKTNSLRRPGRTYTYRRYICGNARTRSGGSCGQTRLLDAGRLEAAVYRALAAEVLQPDALAGLLTGAQVSETAQQQAAAEVARLEGELAGAERAVGRLVEAIDGGGGGVPELAERLARRQAERRQAALALVGARRRLAETGRGDVPDEVIAAFCQEVARVLEQGRPETVRDVLEQVLVEVVAWLPDENGTGRAEMTYRSPWGGAVGRVGFAW